MFLKIVCRANILDSKLGYVFTFLKPYKGLNSNVLRDEVKNVFNRKMVMVMNAIEEETEMTLNLGK